MYGGLCIKQSEANNLLSLLSTIEEINMTIVYLEEEFEMHGMIVLLSNMLECVTNML